jgi:hypothetical protein
VARPQAAAEELVVLEPQPSKAIKALARRGVRINRGSISRVAAVVIAVKPQPRRRRALAAVVTRKPSCLDLGRPHARAVEGALPAPRWCAMPNRRPPSAAASPWRSATPASPRRRGGSRMRILAATGSVEWVDTGADGRGRGVGLRPGLCLPCWPGDGAGRALPACRRRWRLARETVANRANSCIARRCRPPLRGNVASPGGTTAATSSF